MQVAIDNAKRKFDIDLNEEIRRIKRMLNIDSNGLPSFWEITKKDKRKMKSDTARKERDAKNKQKIREHINADLKCPMNYLCELDLSSSRNPNPTLPMSHFWIKYELSEHRRKSEKVEKLIQDYSLDLYNFNISEDKDTADYLLLQDKFDALIRDIRGIYISRNYLGMMSWLINRAFLIGAGAKSKKEYSKSTLYKNKSLLLKVLYTVNPVAFLQCFTRKMDNE